MSAVLELDRFHLDVDAFLRNIFGADYTQAWVTGFSRDPAATSSDGRVQAIAWGGAPYEVDRDRILPNHNNYLCISTFKVGLDGRARRRSNQLAAVYALMIDDVYEKVNVDRVVLPPTFKVQTSPGSQQWWYCLATPTADGQRVRGIIDNLIASGLAANNRDPGMRGVNRYGRLPFGVNTKSKYKREDGSYPEVRLVEPPHWELKYELAVFAHAFGVEMDTFKTLGRVINAAPLPAEAEAFNTALLAALHKEGLYKEDRGGGKHDVTCPWVHEHTDKADNGSAIFEAGYRDTSTGEIYHFGGYRCHHGHGDDIGLRKVVQLLNHRGYAMSIPTPAKPSPYDEFTALPATITPPDDEDSNVVPLTPVSVEYGRYEPSDAANAERMYQLAAGRLLYLADEKIWLFFDGVRWRRDGDSTHITSLALMVATQVLHLSTEAFSQGQDAVSKALNTWARSSRQIGHIGAMITLLSKHPNVPVHSEVIDHDPYLLGVPNGVVDLTTGDLLPANPAQIVTMTAGVRYETAAPPPVIWEAFLRSVLAIAHGAPDELLYRYMRLFLGYCVTGSRKHELFTIFFGSGTNGKSTLLLQLKHVLGDYARAVQPSVFEMTRVAPDANAASPELARLCGARLVMCSETAEHTRLNVALIKQMTGDRIAARNLYQNTFEYTPQFKMVMSTNHLPIVTDTSHAAWRRLHPVPFDCKWKLVTDKPGVSNANLPWADPDLQSKLEEESPGILVWLVRAATDWIATTVNLGEEEGLGRAPQRVRAAQNHYQTNNDILGHWMDEHCEVGAMYEGGALYSDYRRWCEASGVKPVSAFTWSRNMEDRGFRGKYYNNIVTHSGIRLKEFK